MRKLLIVSNPDKVMLDINDKLKERYETKMLGYNYSFINEYLKENKPHFIIVYVSKLTNEEAHNVHMMLQDVTEIPFIVIGEKADCKDFMNSRANITKFIVTPVLLKDCVSEIINQVNFKYGVPEDELPKKDEKAPQKKILIIDDDIVMLRTIMQWLKDYYKVYVAKSGTEGIACLGKEIPDLILLDYEMPVVDGVQTLKMIRSEQKFSSIPVFFLTGVSSTDQVKAAIELKPEGYILKSEGQAKLLAKLKEWFEGLQSVSK